ncbi:hypothetical protein D3C71_1648850 [compost metagenome]
MISKEATVRKMDSGALSSHLSLPGFADVQALRARVGLIQIMLKRLKIRGRLGVLERVASRHDSPTGNERRGNRRKARQNDVGLRVRCQKMQALYRRLGSQRLEQGNKGVIGHIGKLLHIAILAQNLQPFILPLVFIQKGPERNGRLQRGP